MRPRTWILSALLAGCPLPPSPTTADTDVVAVDTLETDETDAEPVDTDGSDTPSAETDPVETDPIETDPVETDPVETDLVETDLVDAEVEPDDTDPPDTLVETDLTDTDLTDTDPVDTDPPDALVETDRTETDPTDPVDADTTAPPDTPVETGAVDTPVDTAASETDTTAPADTALLWDTRWLVVDSGPVWTDTAARFDTDASCATFLRHLSDDFAYWPEDLATWAAVQEAYVAATGECAWETTVRCVMPDGEAYTRVTAQSESVERAWYDAAGGLVAAWFVDDNGGFVTQCGLDLTTCVPDGPELRGGCTDPCPTGAYDPQDFPYDPPDVQVDPDTAPLDVCGAWPALTATFSRLPEDLGSFSGAGEVATPGLLPVALPDRVRFDARTVQVRNQNASYATFSLDAGRYPPKVIATGDVTGDGRADLVVGHSSRTLGAGIWIVPAPIARGNAFLSASPTSIVPVGRSTLGGDMDVWDVTGDGVDDLVAVDLADLTGGPNTGSVLLFAGPIAGALTNADASALWTDAAGPPSWGGVLGLDGRVAVVSGGAEVWLFDAAARGVLAGLTHDVLTPPAGGAVHGLSRLGDQDGDGVDELVVSGVDGSREATTWIVPANLTGARALDDVAIGVRWGGGFALPVGDRGFGVDALAFSIVNWGGFRSCDIPVVGDPPIEARGVAYLSRGPLLGRRAVSVTDDLMIMGDQAWDRLSLSPATGDGTLVVTVTRNGMMFERALGACP